MSTKKGSTQMTAVATKPEPAKSTPGRKPGQKVVRRSPEIRFRTSAEAAMTQIIHGFNRLKIVAAKRLPRTEAQVQKIESILSANLEEVVALLNANHEVGQKARVKFTL